MLHKLLRIVLLILCISPQLTFANENLVPPSFSVDIEVDNPNSIVCFGTTLTLTASTTNASTYELQAFDGTMWSPYGGYTGNIVGGSISVSIANYTTTNTFRFKITGPDGEAFSSQLFVSPQQPTINFQPIDLRGCNGDDAFFRVGATGSGLLQYQWQVNEGGGFVDATASTYKNDNTDVLEVDKLNNGDENRSFRVVIKDGNGCEVISNTANVAVNRHSPPSPTTSTEYCQGDSLILSSSNVVGTVESYQWRMALGTGSSYQTLSNGAKYTGVDAAQLIVRDQQPDERNYQLIVNFQEVSMDASGNAVIGTCDVRQTRRGYVINPRPDFDGTIDAYVDPCEGASVDITISGASGTVNWYTDSTLANVFSGTTYTTLPYISDTSIYVRVEDAKGCLSYAQAVPISVNPLPAFTDLQVPSICPSSSTFEMTYSSFIGNLGQGSVSIGTNALTNFTSQTIDVSSSPITINVPLNAAAGTYDFNIEMTDALTGCNSGLIPFTLKIKEPTVISSQPISGTVCEGENYTMTIAATGEGTLSYQWYFNSTTISGATESNLLVSAVDAAKTGDYYCIVTGDCGNVQSITANLSLKTPTSITTQPVNKTVCAGSDQNFNISATGGGTLQYQWFKGSVPISGATSSTLNLTAIPFSENGTTYYCEVTGDCGKVTSNTVTLTVETAAPAPVVANSTYCKNETAVQLSATLSNSSNSLVWYDAGMTELSGAPTPSTTSDGVINYFVSEKTPNNCESPKSQISITVLSPVEVTINPSATEICTTGTINTSASLTATASGGTGLFQYQWGSIGTSISPNTTNELNVQDAADYYVIVTSASCRDSVGVNISAPIGNVQKPNLSVDGINFPDAVSICPAGNVSIQAIHSQSGAATVNWYGSETSTTTIAVGSPFNLANILTEQIIYGGLSVTQGTLTCEGPRDSLRINLRPLPTIATSVADESCEGSNDGSVLITVKGSNTPYSFSLNNGPISTDLSYSNLAAGTYSLLVKNSLNCELTTSFQVNSTSKPVISSQPVSLNNCDGNTSTFEIEATGFSAIQWQKQLPGGTWMDLTGENDVDLKISNVGDADAPHLTKYRALVKNSTCEVISSEAVLTVNDFTSQLDNQRTCMGADYAYAPPSLVGTVLNYEWQERLNGSSIWNVIQSSSVADLALANRQLSDDNNSYRVKVTFDKGDGSTCVETSDLGRLNINNPVISESILSPNCLGQSSGKITVSTSGGSEPYEYKLDAGAYQSGNEFLNIGAGNYTIGVKDNIGCTALKNVSVSSPDPILAGAIEGVSGDFCAGYNPPEISSSTDASGGSTSAPLSYFWQKDEGCTGNWIEISGATDKIFNPTALQIKTCYRRGVTSSCGDTLYTVPVTISIFDDPTITISSNKDSICSNEVVNFDATLIGGAGSCPITWQTNDRTNAPSSSFWQEITESGAAISLSNFQNTTTTPITMYVRAIVDCAPSSCNKATSDALEIVINPQIELDLNIADSTICEGNSIVLEASNCTGELTWNDGVTTSSRTISPTLTTSYTATCMGKCNSVSLTANITVVAAVGLPIIVAERLLNCSGDSVLMTASGCTAPYEWSNGFVGESQYVKPSSTTSYSVVCKNAQCTSSPSNVIEIEVAEPLSAGVISELSGTFCDGYNPPEISSVTDASGGSASAPFQYFWQKSEGCSGIWVEIAGENDEDFNPNTLNTTTCFRRGVTSSCGDTLYSNTSTIAISPDPAITVSSNKTNICSNESITFNSSLIGGAGSCTITWQLNTKSNAPSSSFWEDLTDIGNSITLTSLVNTESTPQSQYIRAIVDCAPSSCNKATSDAFEVIIDPTFDFSFASNDTTICDGNTVDISSIACGGTLLWQDGFASSTRVETPTTTTTYAATCTNSCGSSTKSVTVTVLPGLAKPLNNSPLFAVLPNVLTFDAIGTNLKWYEDSVTTVFTNTPPSFSTTGKHDYWVSQSNTTCESPRLKIEAELFEPLKIVQLSNDQYDCEGNSVKFAAEAVGVGNLHYYWQRKRPYDDDFIYLNEDDRGVKNVNTPYLTVSGVGNYDNPNGSIYRCQIVDREGTLTSEPRTLIANVLYGSLPNLDACVGQSYEIDLPQFITIEGDVEKYQWQIRVGSDWEDLSDGDYRSGTSSNKLTFSELFTWHSGRYRCRVYFKTGGFQCIESTDLTTFTVGEYPSKPIVANEDYCQGKTTRLVRYRAEKENDERWYLTANQPIGTGTNKEPRPSSAEAGVITYYVSQISDEGCESERAELLVTIHPKPDAPENTTPEFVNEGQTLTFTAAGENLKWYTSRTGTTFTTVAPQYTEIDSYKHYVLQESEVGCQSERTLIEASIVGELGFISQPKELSECKGNTVTFKVKGKGKGVLFYQWQKKLPGEDNFSFIPDSFDDDFQISDAGDEENPDGTFYRALISDGVDSVYSDPAKLIVNELSGSIEDMALCKSANTIVDASTLDVKGRVSEYLLQKQDGSIWNTVQSSKELTFQIDSVDQLPSGNYRVRVLFVSEINAICPRNSKEFEISIKEEEMLTEIPSEIAFCENEALSTLLESLDLSLDTKVYDVVQDSLSPITSLPSKDEGNLIFEVKGSSGCTQISNVVKYTAKEAELLSFSDQDLLTCVGSEFDLSFLEDDATYKWFVEDDEIEPDFNVQNPRSFQYSVARFGENKCLSEKVNLEFEVELCIAQESVACSFVSKSNLDLDDWNFLSDSNGKVVLAIHPKGQNLGTVSVNYKLANQESPIASVAGTQYLPRYFNLSAQNAFQNPVGLRFYFSEQEYEDYLDQFNPAEANGDFISLVHYEGMNEDCELANNDNFDNGLAQVTLDDLTMTNLGDGIVYLELLANSFSEFGFTSNTFVNNANLAVSQSPEGIEISYTDTQSIRPGAYKLEKKRATSNWEYLGLVDEITLDPFIANGEFFYRVVYVDEDGVQKIAATADLVVTNADLKCFTFPNPTFQISETKLFLGDLKLDEYRMIDTKGQVYPLELNQYNSGLYNINLPFEPRDGTYIIELKDEKGNLCAVKVVKD